MPPKDIQTQAQELKIPQLVHFTRAANLPTILKHGLYPLSRKDEIGITPLINDQLRLDGHLDGTSLSVSFPNFRMFYKYRQENPGIEWVVLGIKPSVLWEKDCAFCCHNAADNRISEQQLANLKTLGAFQGMFAEIEGHQTRTEQRLKPFDPTDSQAEVLVFDIIEPELIFGVIFENAKALSASKQICGDRDIRVNQAGQGFFASRSFVR
ncbi:DUF4433 domain-containing protein [Pseudomonas sp. IT-P2]|jgi:hypothetical protein|uniref:DarT ssDNA thymidine ADP-ribosyltransferase family protein n=1 Tax=Pseudomonas sp. IT-P2 TaxID=3026456 RepID=UPI0039DF64DB